MIGEAESQKQDYKNHVNQTEKELDSEKIGMADKPPCKEQGKETHHNGF